MNNSPKIDPKDSHQTNQPSAIKLEMERLKLKDQKMVALLRALRKYKRELVVEKTGESIVPPRAI